MLSSGVPITIKEISHTLANLCKKDIRPNILSKYRKGDIRHCYADILKIKNKLESEPKVGFKE